MRQRWDRVSRDIQRSQASEPRRTLDDGRRVDAKERRGAHDAEVARGANEVDDEAVALARVGREAEPAAKHLKEEVLRTGRTREEDAVDCGKVGCAEAQAKESAEGPASNQRKCERDAPPSVRIPQLTSTANSPALKARYSSSRSFCLVPS